MQLLRALETYIPLAEIFAYGRFYEKEDTAFLDSSLENELGRYSILGLKPYLKLVKGEKFTVNGVESEIGFEEYVRTYLKEHRQENPTELPLTAGAIGYFSYEYGRKKEDVKTRHKNGVDMPDAVLVFYDVFLIEDTREKVLYTVANGESVEPEKALAEVEELVREAAGLAGDNAGCVIENVNTGEAFRLRENQIVVEKSGSREDSTLADLVCDETDSMADPKQAHAVSGNAYTDSENRGDGLVEETPIPHVSHPHLKITPDFTHEDYKDAIDRMIQYIIEGDIYIANMTRQLAIESPKAPYEVFRTLRKNNPSPFGGFFNYGNFQVVGGLTGAFPEGKGPSHCHPAHQGHEKTGRDTGGGRASPGRARGLGERQERASDDRGSGAERPQPGFRAGLREGDRALHCGRVCHRLPPHLQRGGRFKAGTHGDGSHRGGFPGRFHHRRA